jgi:hypothetical protein
VVLRREPPNRNLEFREQLTQRTHTTIYLPPLFTATSPAMPPKGKKAGASANKQKEEDREEPLQAVVSILCCRHLTPHRTLTSPILQILADSFETRFRPLTLDKPRVRPLSDPSRMSRIPEADHIARVVVPATPRQHPSYRVYFGIPCQCRRR